MHQIRALMSGLIYKVIAGDIDCEIDSVIYDSRKVVQNSLFVCVKGYISDGHAYIRQAIAKGAIAVLIQEDQSILTNDELLMLAEEEHVLILAVLDTRKALAKASASLYKNPSTEMHMIGVTGTKGKTTTTYMIREIYEQAGKNTGLIGTVSNIIAGKVCPASHTTPESNDLQQILREMADGQQEICVMEVSSQGLMLDRVYGCNFEIAAFTNLYRDHIGTHEHSDMEDYLCAKLKIFDRSEIAVINADCEVSDRVIEYATTKCKIFTYGINTACDVRASHIRKAKVSGKIGSYFYLKTPWYEGEVFVAMAGNFNIYNALCAIAVTGASGISFEYIKKGLDHVFVPGRLQAVHNDNSFSVFVDYAHNAASLENILLTLREYCTGRLITVFGCGGDRSTTRRFEQGEISGKYSDLTIITSDNPRSEDPNEIISHIETGIKKTAGKYMIEPDRRSAIALAFSLACDDDFVIIAGKGHENYQIFHDRTIHFDDVETAYELLEEGKRK